MAVNTINTGPAPGVVDTEGSGSAKTASPVSASPPTAASQTTKPSSQDPTQHQTSSSNTQQSSNPTDSFHPKIPTRYLDSFERSDTLVGPQELPANRLLVQQLKQKCARGEARALHTLGYAGTALVLGGVGAGLASGGMFGKKFFLGKAEKIVHSLANLTDSDLGQTIDFDKLRSTTDKIPGKTGAKASALIEKNLAKHQGNLQAALHDIHTDLVHLDSQVQNKMKIDEGFALGLGVLGGVSILTGGILLIRRRGQEHYFRQAGRCTEDGLRLQLYENEINRVETRGLDRKAGGNRKRTKRNVSLFPKFSKTGVSLDFSLRF